VQAYRGFESPPLRQPPDRRVRLSIKSIIRDGKLAPVRAILQWAIDNRKLDANPGARINIDPKARSSEKRRGYTDDEAKIIL
jgi:hypothetical protein